MLIDDNSPSQSEELYPYITLTGHTENVEDLCFNPSNWNELCSSSQDQTVLIWDTRAGTTPSLKVEDIHSDDINWVDWNPNNPNLLLTGSSDFTVSIVDIRKGKPIKYFDQHKSSVNLLKWSPFKANVFASTGYSLMIWDLNREDDELILNHWGHVAPIVDFDWNWADEWSIMSTSDESDTVVFHEDGSLQLFRPIDLITDDLETAAKSFNEWLEVEPC